MSYVVGMDASNAARAPQARVDSALNKTRSGIFAELFESVRLEARTPAALLDPHERQKSIDAETDDQLADTLAEDDAEAIEQAAAEASARDEPSRVDRLRERAGKAGERIEQPSRDSGAERRSELREMRARQDQASDAAKHKTPDSAPSDAPLNPAVEPGTTRRPSGNASTPASTSGTPHGSTPAPATNGQASSSDPKGLPPEFAAEKGPHALNGAASTLNAASGQAASAVVPGNGSGGQGTATGREGGNAAAQTADQVASLRAAGTVGRAPAGQLDFNTVMEAASRARAGASASTARRATGSNGSPGPDGTVNIRDAKAITELSRLVRSSIGSQRSVMMLRLDPPELGQLRIEVRMQQQTLTLRVEAQTPAGHEALQARLPELRHALEQQGIQVGRMDVELRPPGMPTSTPDDAGTQPQTNHQQDAGAAGDHSQPGGQGDASSPMHEPTATANGSQGNEVDASEEQEHGMHGDPAETGVDLVV